MSSPSAEPRREFRILPGPGLPDGLVIAADELRESFSRSSGPGGQHVNTTDTRVRLEFDVVGSASLDEQQRARVVRALGDRLVAGRVLITAAEHRSQHRNRVAARERLVELLRTALAPPPPARRRTKPTRGSQRRRLDAKSRRGDVKRLRGRVRDD